MDFTSIKNNSNLNNAKKQTMKNNKITLTENDDDETVNKLSTTEALLEIPYEQRKAIAQAFAIFSEHSEDPEVDAPVRKIVQRVIKAMKLELDDQQAIFSLFLNCNQPDVAYEIADYLQVEEECSWPAMWNLLVLILVEGNYDARLRVALCHMAQLLNIPVERLRAAEEGVAQELSIALEKQKELAKKNDTSNRRKYLAIGIAGALGGTALLITGGLAAPFVIPAFGAVIAGVGSVTAVIGLGAVGTAATGVASTILAVGGVPMITALFGTLGAGLTGYKMSRRVSGLNTFEFHKVKSDKVDLALQQSDKKAKKDEITAGEGGMQVFIGISGLVDKKESMGEEWQCMREELNGFGDHYSLVFDPDVLSDLTHVLRNMIVSTIASKAKSFWIGMVSVSVSTLLASATWPLTTLAFTGLITSPYSMAIDRAEKAGRLLAKVLSDDHVQGNRPVTLVGSSIGARTIFICCEELAKQSKKGIIENIILIGAAVPSDPDQKSRWENVCNVVAGRVVNVHSSKDWCLAFIYRAMHLSYSVAGLFPVEYGKVENLDVSEIIGGHFDYTDRNKLAQILKFVSLGSSLKTIA